MQYQKIWLVLKREELNSKHLNSGRNKIVDMVFKCGKVIVSSLKLEVWNDTGVQKNALDVFWCFKARI
jgi:hypothetical protein